MALKVHYHKKSNEPHDLYIDAGNATISARWVDFVNIVSPEVIEDFVYHKVFQCLVSVYQFNGLLTVVPYNLRRMRHLVGPLVLVLMMMVDSNYWIMLLQ